MFRNLLLVGLLAGVLTGTLLTIVQSFSVLPIIRQAEQYEGTANPATRPDAPHEHQEAAIEWQPAEGIERLAFTWLANLSIGAGFGLMMTGIMTLRRPHTLTQALLFGIGGYYVIFVAPALLLPPELPGAESHDLQTRQATWLFTVVTSLAGLCILAWSSPHWKRLLGFVVICSPFLLFSRHQVNYADPVPPVLIGRFAWMTGFTNLLFWIALGSLVYWLQKRWIQTPGHRLQ